MAREIVALSPYELILREISDPVPDEGEVLVRSEFGAAKHGTEMASVKGMVTGDASTRSFGCL